MTFTVTVKPKKTTLKGLSTKSGKIAVKWTKISEKVGNCDGYYVRYSTSKDFTKKSTKSKAVKGRTKSSVTIQGLTVGKTYYVKIYTYKVMGGKTYYSSASNVKKIKVK